MFANFWSILFYCLFTAFAPEKILKNIEAPVNEFAPSLTPFLIFPATLATQPRCCVSNTSTLLPQALCIGCSFSLEASPLRGPVELLPPSRL